MIRNIIVCIVILVGQRYALGQATHVGGLSCGDDVFQEKIYLHTDKEFYMPGELIWFKVYVVDGWSLQPSAISRVAYVDVLDSNYTSVLRAKIELGIDRSNSGSLYVPNDIESGAYHIIAYTHFMKNQGPERVFSKQVTLVNPFLEVRQEPHNGPDMDYVLQVYPESGILLDGVATRIGYKLQVRGGGGMAFDAVIVDDRGVELSQFTANKHGMGSFTLTPRTGIQYMVIATLPDGSSVHAPIPEITTGYLFNVVRNRSNDLNMTIAASPVHANKRLYLQVRSGGYVLRTEKILLDDLARAAVGMAKTTLPDGVICLTLLDSDKQPVAERLVFQYPVKQLNISAELATKAVGERDTVELLIKSSVEGKPVVSDLSVAVYRMDQLQQRPTSDIRSYLWLQSEVRGYIEDIGYYFSDISQDQLAAELDDLLLTQGWRRITSKADMGFIAEYKSQRVVVRYTDGLTKRPLAGEAVFLSVPGKNHHLYVGETNHDGIAHFNIKGVYGPVQLATRLASGKESDVELLPAFYVDMSAARLPTGRFDLSSAHVDTIGAHGINVQVENAYRNQERAQFLKFEIDTLPFYGSADKTYWLDDYTRFVIMEEVLREYVSEINVRRHRSDFNLHVFNQRRGGYFSVDPLILLDGIPLTNANELMSYNPLNLQKMEIIMSKYYHGPLEYDGVVSASTYNGTLDGFQLHPSTTLLNYEGMQYQREFFTPVYENELEKKSRLPDLRSVLLWEPDVKTTPAGQSRLVITTSDLPGDYIVVVEGLDNHGNVGSSISRFTIR